MLGAIHIKNPPALHTEHRPEEADAPKGVEYEERIVAFIDILGFKEIIARSVNDPTLVRQIHNALDIQNDELASHYAAEIGVSRSPEEFSERFHTFSDCIVMSVSNDAEELGLLIFMAFKVCRQLLHAGFLTRGGIASGKLLHRAPSGADKAAYEHSPMVFGPAFNDAYTLEANHADGARVILQNAVRKKINDYCERNNSSRLCEFFRTHIKRAGDGPAYINLFADFPGNSFYGPSSDVTSNIQEIHQGLQNALNGSTDRPTQFRKNAMLATQFNKAIERACEINHALSTYAMDPSILPRAD